MDCLIKSVRFELVELRPFETKDFDRITPNGVKLVSVCLFSSF